MPRRRRADAERNRARILDAARSLFAERGDEVQMEEVARRAGVGVGTLYRHFPTKEAMVEAAAEQRFGEILTVYRTARVDAPDALEALRGLLRRVGEAQTRDRGFCHVVEATIGSDEPRGEVRRQLEIEMAALIRQGHETGVISRDVAAADIFVVTCGLAAIIRWSSGDWRRYIDIVIEGVRSR